MECIDNGRVNDCQDGGKQIWNKDLETRLKQLWVGKEWYVTPWFLFILILIEFKIVLCYLLECFN